MTVKSQLTNYRIDVSDLNTGRTWQNKMVLPLVTDSIEQNALNLLTLILVLNENKAANIKVNAESFNYSPDICVSTQQGSLNNTIWLFTRVVSPAYLKRASHKCLSAVTISTSTITHESDVVFEAEFVHNLLPLISRAIKWHVVIEDKTISICDGVTYVQGEFKQNVSLTGVTEPIKKRA